MQAAQTPNNNPSVDSGAMYGELPKELMKQLAIPFANYQLYVEGNIQRGLAKLRLGVKIGPKWVFVKWRATKAPRGEEILIGHSDMNRMKHVTSKDVCIQLCSHPCFYNH